MRRKSSARKPQQKIYPGVAVARTRSGGRSLAIKLEYANLVMRRRSRKETQKIASLSEERIDYIQVIYVGVGSWAVAEMNSY